MVELQFYVHSHSARVILNFLRVCVLQPFEKLLDLHRVDHCRIWQKAGASSSASRTWLSHVRRAGLEHPAVRHLMFMCQRSKLVVHGGLSVISEQQEGNKERLYKRSPVYG